MKTLHLGIIIGGGIVTAIIVSMLIMSDTTSNKMTPHGLPVSPGIALHFNGSDLDHSPFNQFEARQGQNITLVVDVTSEPENIPLTLYTEPHIGFTNTNGLDLKLSSTRVNTPGTVLLYISVGKDATPNKYKMGVWASTMTNGNMTLRTDFNIVVTNSTS